MRHVPVCTQVGTWATTWQSGGARHASIPNSSMCRTFLIKSMCTLTPKEPCVEQSRICKNCLFSTGDVKVVFISRYFLHHPHGLNVIIVKAMITIILYHCLNYRNEAMKPNDGIVQGVHECSLLACVARLDGCVVFFPPLST